MNIYDISKQYQVIVRSLPDSDNIILNTFIDASCSKEAIVKVLNNQLGYDIDESNISSVNTKYAKLRVNTKLYNIKRKSAYVIHTIW